MGAEANKRVLFVAGTRPEIIKMAPVVDCARAELGQVTWLLTGQHQALANSVLTDLNVAVDEKLNVLQPGATLGQLTVRLMQAMDDALAKHNPAVVVVQGDTTTAMIAGLASFSRRIPVVHIEAGLRSGDLKHPFPEEVNRKIVGVFADLHCAPTSKARDNLLAEGVAADRILVTGNTVVDTLEMISGNLKQYGVVKKQILVTLHRRESWDGGIEESCRAIGRLAQCRDDIEFIFPVHTNPLVQSQVRAVLGGYDTVRLVDPMGYLELQSLLSQSWLVLTDSGGIQEEAPSYRVPVFVLRNVTERPEAVEQGQARMIGTDGDTIYKSCLELLDDPERYKAMQQGTNPFGDGRASNRIVRVLEYLLHNQFDKIQDIEPFE